MRNYDKKAIPTASDLACRLALALFAVTFLAGSVLRAEETPPDEEIIIETSDDDSVVLEEPFEARMILERIRELQTPLPEGNGCLLYTSPSPRDPE